MEEREIFCNSVSKLPNDVIYLSFKESILKYRSIAQILEEASFYSSCLSRDQSKGNFYNEKAWKIMLEVIGRIILFYAPKQLFNGKFEKGFVPISPLPEKFYPNGLFRFIPIFPSEFEVFDSWNKYRLAWGLHDEKLYLLDNNSNQHPLGKNTIFAHSTLYFAFIENNELKIFIDEPWISENAIFSMKIKENLLYSNLGIELKETVEGLMLIFHKTMQNYNDTYAREKIYKIDLLEKEYELIHKIPKYLLSHHEESFDEGSAYSYGSSMVLFTRYDSSSHEKIYFEKVLQSYDGETIYSLNKEKEISDLGTTGLVGYDWSFIPSSDTSSSNFLINKDGDFIRYLPHPSSYKFLTYFESFYVVIHNLSEMDETRIDVVDLLTGQILAFSVFTHIKPDKIFVTRKNDRTGYIVWVNNNSIEYML